MASIFTRIIQGDIPAHKIAENERYLAFLDAFPLVKGHTLVIPKVEVDYIFDLEDDWLSGLLLFTKGVAKAVHKAMPCERIGVSVVGLEVPHTHVHLIPIHQVSDMDFSRPKLKLDQNELSEIAAAIREHYH